MTKQKTNKKINPLFMLTRNMFDRETVLAEEAGDHSDDYYSPLVKTKAYNYKFSESPRGYMTTKHRTIGGFKLKWVTRHPSIGLKVKGNINADSYYEFYINNRLITRELNKAYKPKTGNYEFTSETLVDITKNKAVRQSLIEIRLNC